MTNRIFISYRRDDSQGSAGRLRDKLVQHFPAEHVFMDVDNVEPGIDFVTSIEEAVGDCDVLLAVIGRSWLSSADNQGRRRLDSPEDYVGLEIAAALARDIRVIPVLVDGAEMPHSEEMPAGIAMLARRNAIALRHDRFDDDSARLIKVLRRALGDDGLAAVPDTVETQGTEKAMGDSGPPEPAPPSRGRFRKVIIYGGLLFVLFIATNGFGKGTMSEPGVNTAQLILIGLALWFGGRKLLRMWKARSSA
ncbi:MAG: toll/interleukin-1 receptor domain-containing protein [Hyphomicrobiales bacterium]